MKNTGVHEQPQDTENESGNSIWGLQCFRYRKVHTEACIPIKIHFRRHQKAISIPGNMTLFFIFKLGPMYEDRLVELAENDEHSILFEEFRLHTET